MRGSTIARNYAGALFELADRDEALESYGEGLALLAALLEEEPRLRRFLETPRITLAAKKSLLRNALGGRVPTPVVNFTLLTLDRRRQRLLGEMAAEYAYLLDERMGRARVEVSLSREPDENELEEIRTRLSRILGREAIPRVEVDPELLGGITFRSGDTIFDGSVRRRLERMRRRLLSTEVPTD